MAGNETKDGEEALVVFQGKGIRRIWNEDEWWYSVIDVVGILSESQDPRNYWKVLKHRLIQEGGNETVTNCNLLKLTFSPLYLMLYNYRKAYEVEVL